MQSYITYTCKSVHIFWHRQENHDEKSKKDAFCRFFVTFDFHIARKKAGN